MRHVLFAMLMLATACGSKPTAPAYEGADYKDQTAKLAHGARISRIVGCQSCHGDNLQGRNVTPGDDIGDMYAPNVTLWLPKYSDADLDKLIRHGVPKDGRDLWWMPPENFQFLSDPDFAALVAYLRTFKPAGTQLPPIRKGPEFQRLVKEEGLEPAVPTVARFKRETPIDLGERHRLGRYIAMTTCTECHNSKLQGYKDFTPDLIIAGAYSREEFERLITQGELPNGRKPKNELMTEVAKARFVHLTSDERGALYGYLKARAEQPQ